MNPKVRKFKSLKDLPGLPKGAIFEGDFDDGVLIGYVFTDGIDSYIFPKWSVEANKDWFIEVLEETLGKKLRVARESKRIYLEDIAKESDKSASAISMLEKKDDDYFNRNCSPDILKAYKKLCQINISEFI